MNFWKTLMVGFMTLALGLSLSLSPVNAASSSSAKSKEAAKKEAAKKAAAKKKEEARKKEEAKKREAAKKRESKKEVRHYSGVQDGMNLAGRPGYIISDTASTLHKGQVAGAAHITFDSWGSVVQIPVGVSFGITDEIQLNANTSFFAASGVSGIYYLNLGGKYGFKTSVKNFKFAAGFDLAIGPLSNSIYGYSTFGFDPYGVVTYTFSDGLQLNGKLGLYIQTYDYDLGPINVSGTYSFFQLDLGAAYPFDANLTGFAELATNGVVAGGGIGGTPLLVGIRTGRDVQLQAFGGLDLGGQVGLFIGGGIALVSM